MGTVTKDELCQLVDGTLCGIFGKDRLSTPIGPESKMGEPEEWDSLSFVAVLAAVSQSYDIELADDDAFHFTSIPTMHAFLAEVL